MTLTVVFALADKLRARGVGLVVLNQQIDTTTPTGRLVFHILGAIDEFQRELIAEAVGVHRTTIYDYLRGEHVGRAPADG